MVILNCPGPEELTGIKSPQTGTLADVPGPEEFTGISMRTKVVAGALAGTAVIAAAAEALWHFI